jgi:hypothetical protein
MTTPVQVIWVWEREQTHWSALHSLNNPNNTSAVVPTSHIVEPVFAGTSDTPTTTPLRLNNTARMRDETLWQ